MDRRVFIVKDEDSFLAFCEPCIDGMVDPAATRAAVVSRADGAHCIECDYHPDCTDFCRNRTLDDMSRVGRIIASMWPEPWTPAEEIVNG